MTTTTRKRVNDLSFTVLSLPLPPQPRSHPNNPLLRAQNAREICKKNKRGGREETRE